MWRHSLILLSEISRALFFVPVRSIRFAFIWFDTAIAIIGGRQYQVYWLWCCWCCCHLFFLHAIACEYVPPRGYKKDLVSLHFHRYLITLLSFGRRFTQQSLYPTLTSTSFEQNVVFHHCTHNLMSSVYCLHLTGMIPIVLLVFIGLLEMQPSNLTMTSLCIFDWVFSITVADDINSTSTRSWCLGEIE